LSIKGLRPKSKTDTAHDAPLEMPDRSRAEPLQRMLPEHKPVRRGREMIDPLTVEEPKA
jgi:hypothetical protein